MSTFSLLLISETAPVDFVTILDMRFFFFFFFLFCLFFIVSMASIGLEACFGFVSGHSHDVPDWYLGCIEEMHRYRPQAVVYIILAKKAFWQRTDIIVPANEKLDIIMLIGQTVQTVEIQISIQRLHSGCLLDTLLHSKTMLFKF